MRSGRETCAVVICHGQSEYKLVSTIKSTLRLNLQIFARKRGRSSIQINKLPDIFSDGIFRNVKSLTQEYASIEHKAKQLINCKIFTIMDVDDCEDASIKSNYLNGHISNIGKHELKPFIQPIYFQENLEEVLTDIGFEFVAKDNSDKTHYIQVFDSSTGVLTDEQAITNLYDNCCKSNKTNFDIFLKYCLGNKPTL